MPEPLPITLPLFVPATRPQRFDKAARSGADAVILDLEDAVAPGDKAAARAALTVDFTDRPVVVRINAARTPWHDDDLAAVATLPFAAIMLPKAERLDDLARVAAVRPVIALIETARGLAAARDIAASGHAALIAFGSVDMAADLGCAHVREALVAARCELVLASRLGRLPAPLDGVTTSISDADAILDDARYARALGFGGKLLIHPDQVAAASTGLRPSADELAWAQRIVASGDGAVAIDGAMVDEPVRARARAIIARVPAR